ncbi:MAG TPA: hypothetical protein VG848_03085, partial [Acetobacteraceae bacterium]|nr:hypothetical protein [Acetobacteraceae bacterium]
LGRKNQRTFIPSFVIHGRRLDQHGFWRIAKRSDKTIKLIEKTKPERNDKNYHALVRKPEKVFLLLSLQKKKPSSF